LLHVTSLILSDLIAGLSTGIATMSTCCSLARLQVEE